MVRIKKSLMLTGVFVIIFLMISTVTIVPKAQASNINITPNKNLNKNRQILKQGTKENNQHITNILLKIESLKNSKEVNDQAKNIDTLIKQKLGENYLEEFEKGQINIETAKQKIKDIYKILNPYSNLKIASHSIDKLCESIEGFATTSSLEKDIDIDVLIGSIASAWIFVIGSKIYRSGLPIALCITISANIVYNLLLAKAIFLSNTPLVATFVMIALFKISTIYSVFVSFTWPFWLAFIIYEKIVSGEPILNQYNNLLTNKI